ncbi:MAG: nitroreductase family protein [Dehalococcoidales bacterium]|nr:nitroreductase family protein [Dehalococcoidales bacterium]
MNVNISTWYPAIYSRRSRRSYNPQPIDPKLLNSINDFCQNFRPFNNARAVLVLQQVDKAFRGIIGPSGAPAFIAFVGNVNDNHIQEKIGYIGEAVILEATSLGLSTCWVGGFLRKNMIEELVDADSREEVFGLTPIGYAVERTSVKENIMAGFGWSHRRKSLSKLVSGLPEKDWPDWTRGAIEAARIAPSAMNRQPWKFHIGMDSIIISTNETGHDFNLSKRLDCGIAMLHIEVAALNQGLNGKWELLDTPEVARFTIDNT